MKTILALVMLAATVHAADDPLDKFLYVPGPGGDAARHMAKYPPLFLEWPAETEARRSLLELRERLARNGQLSPRLDLAIANEIVYLQTCFRAARQSQYEREQLEAELCDLHQQLDSIRLALRIP